MRLWPTLLVVLLAGCAESTTKPTTSNSSGSTSGKIVTAAPEETFECDRDLILEPHLPQECIPPEPVVQKPVEPPKPDPIVGTYRMFRETPDRFQSVFRIYADNRAGSHGQKQYLWEREGNIYWFLVKNADGVTYRKHFAFEHQSIIGEPDLVSVPDAGSFKGLSTEGLKVSDNPQHLFDFYVVSCEGRCSSIRKDENGKEVFHEQKKPGSHWIRKVLDPQGEWKCQNVGRRLKNTTLWIAAGNNGNAPVHGDTLQECQSRCEQAMLNKFEYVGEGNCSD